MAHLRGLQSRLAIVTGAAQGIGWKTAQILQQAGMRVIAVDRTGGWKIGEGSLQTPLHYPVVAFPHIDIAQPEHIEHLFARIEAEFVEETPHLLVNCAGITRDAMLHKASLEDFDTVLDVNLRGPWLLSRRFVQAVIAGKARASRPSIVNISSIVGKTGTIGASSYAASKAGLVGLTKSCAKEYGKHGIRCNAILPGFIKTPMAQAVPEKVLEKFRQRIPLGHLGDPASIAEAVAFLASENASYITGAALEVTGGLDM